MDEAEHLGKRLQKARVHAGLTQQGLCQRAKLSYSTLTKIERGAIKSPSIFTIQSIAGALGTSLDQLMGGQHASGRKLRSKSGVSFVYFDINGCLVGSFYDAFDRLAEESGAPPDVIETAFWRYNDDVCRGDLTMEEFNRVFAREIGLPNIDWQAYYLDAVSPVKGMHELVKKAAKNYRVGILTNIMPGLVSIMKERGLIPDVAYEAVIDSSEVKAIKPEPKIYDIAAERAALPAQEILLVDDTRTNLMAAQKQGWHVLWFDDSRPENSVGRIKSTLEPADQSGPHL